MDEKDILREVIDAKKKATKRAGMVKTSDVGGGTTDKSNPTPLRKYTNTEKCDCDCHPDKIECMNCYDHPTHLSKKLQKNS
jgi:hypothetical protein